MGPSDFEHFMDEQFSCGRSVNLLKLVWLKMSDILLHHHMAAHLNHFMEYYSKQNNNLTKAVMVVGTQLLFPDNLHSIFYSSLFFFFPH